MLVGCAPVILLGLLGTRAPMIVGYPLNQLPHMVPAQKAGLHNQLGP